MLLIGNGIVVTRDRENPYIENGALCIKEDLIEEVGEFKELREKYKEAEFIDAKGGVIMPGLINTHNHIYSAFARGMSIPGSNPADFLEILEGTWWRLDRKLTLKQVFLSAKGTYLDCIKNGVTTLFDHHASFGEIKGSLFEIAKAAKETGLRSCLCYEISDRDGIEKRNQSIEENMDFMEYVEKESSNMLKAMIGLHASFTLSDETLKLCEKRNLYKGGFHIHVAEGLSDALSCKETYGMSVVKRLNKLGILGERTIAAHCVHIDQEDMEILRDTGTMVVHNPQSNMGNAVGCPDVLTMYKKGITIGLGTDGYTNDMLESYKVANVLHKHNSKNPSAAFLEIPDMLFYKNRIIGERFFHKPLGILKKGAFGDVIILEYNPPTPMNEKNINSHILFGMNGRNTVTTIVNGKVLMKDRKVTGIDEEELMKECRKEAGALWKAICG